MEDKKEVQENLELDNRDVDATESKKLEGSEEDRPLLAGKYYAVDDLEKGYKELLKAYSAKENFQRRYEDLEKSVRTPEEYVVPHDLIETSEKILDEATEKAKKLKLTQSQFINLVNDTIAKTQEIEERQSERERQLRIKYGDDHYTKLIDWVKSEKNFNDSEIASFTDESIERLNNERTRFLNTTTSVSSSAYTPISKSDVDKAYREFMQADRSGDRELANKRFDKWKRLAERVG